MKIPQNLRYRGLLGCTALGALIFYGALFPASHAAQAQRSNNATQPTTFASITPQAGNGAEALINDLGNKAISFLSDASLTDAKRTQEFSKLLSNNFDMKTIGRFALGRYWHNANETQRDEYFQLFEDMVISVYSQRFNEYSDQQFSILGSRADGPRDNIVQSLITNKSGGSDIHVDWRVRQKKDGGYKVVDVIVEGVSMSVTQRSDFSSVIQRGGGNIEVLLNHLRKS